MAQNLSTEMKPGAVSVAAQQGLYFSQSPLPPTQTVAGESYCTVSQSQTINFTQQTLRQRAPPRSADKMLHPQMIRAQQQPQQPPAQVGVRPPPPEYKPQPQPPNVPLLHAMMGQRGFSPTRRVAQQPIPPSANISLRPMLRPQQQQPQQHPVGYMNPGVNSVPTLHVRAQYPRPQKPPQAMGLGNDAMTSNSPEWRHLLLAQQQHQQQQQQQQHQQQQHQQQQQARPTFHQAQGIAFASGGVQMTAGQMQQQLSHMAQQQTLGVQHNNSQMSLSLHMQQTMGGRTAQNTNTIGQLPVTFQTPSSGAPTPAAYSTGYGNATTNFQHSVPYPQLPSDLNLDFLEHLPTSDSTHFSDQELLNSLESGASFNLQDIL